MSLKATSVLSFNNRSNSQSAKGFSAKRVAALVAPLGFETYIYLNLEVEPSVLVSNSIQTTVVAPNAPKTSIR